jgi:hypothetical protein
VVRAGTPRRLRAERREPHDWPGRGRRTIQRKVAARRDSRGQGRDDGRVQRDDSGNASAPWPSDRAYQASGEGGDGVSLSSGPQPPGPQLRTVGFNRIVGSRTAQPELTNSSPRHSGLGTAEQHISPLITWRNCNCWSSLCPALHRRARDIGYITMSLTPHQNPMHCAGSARKLI